MWLTLEDLDEWEILLIHSDPHPQTVIVSDEEGVRVLMESHESTMEW